MYKSQPPDLKGFNYRFRNLSEEEKEEAKNLIRRYLELVVKIADEHWETHRRQDSASHKDQTDDISS